MAESQDEPDQSAEGDALKDKVDAMMADQGKDPIPAVSMDTDDQAKAQPQPTKSAPALPKAYKLKQPDKPPLVIKLTDPETSAGQVEPKADEPVAENQEPEAAEPVSSSTNLEDSATDKAVDDIASSESDMVLAVDDARAAHKAKLISGGPGWKAKLKGLVKNKWTWVALIGVLLVVLALPQSRYPLLGLVIKKPVTITVIDSKTATPVSSAEVQLAGASAKTNANGQAHLSAAIGKHLLKISKQYYQSTSETYFVGLKSAAPLSVHILATGRLVPITVLNTISGQPLSGAQLDLKGTSAKTNSKGLVTVALPTTATSYQATLSLSGYNTATITVMVTDQVVKANSFSLTPAGHIYFLSNLSGNIDVVKTNLDGSGRKTVLAGTGKEDPNTTSLLASRDWRYLVLKAQRDTSQAALYLIDTSTDKVTQFDSSNADFTLVGWYNHDFIYSLTRSDLSNWQSGRQILKSYDADNLQLNQLDQDQAEGSATSYAYQNLFNFYILNGLVAYNTQWITYNASGSAYDTTGKSDTIRAVTPNGQNKKDYQTFPASTTGYIQAALYSPQALYYSVYDNGSSQTSYYDFENQVAKTVSIDNSTFSQAYPTYLLSPSGNQTFWTQLRDGKNSLFLGDANAGSQKQIASLSDYSPYGWYSDSYVLVTKNSSELYIMPASVLSSGAQPLKLTDYYKPAQSFSGYGYGYGGL